MSCGSIGSNIFMRIESMKRKPAANKNRTASNLASRKNGKAASNGAGELSSFGKKTIESFRQINAGEGVVIKGNDLKRGIKKILK